METVVGPVAVIAIVTAGVVGPVWLAGLARRAREEAGARQIAVTEAIHRELGAAVSPMVSPRLWGPWQLCIPFGGGQEPVLGTVLAIAAHTMSRFEEFDRHQRRGFEIVMTPRSECRRPAHRGK
jgi:hypothetical protein